MKEDTIQIEVGPIENGSIKMYIKWFRCGFLVKDEIQHIVDGDTINFMGLDIFPPDRKSTLRLVWEMLSSPFRKSKGDKS